MQHRRDETGAATLLVLAFAFMLVVVALIAGSVVSAVVSHRVAQNAADLAALAGAVEGSCDRAAEIAQANRASLVACRLEGDVVTVEVAVTTILGHRAEMHARARAGPQPTSEPSNATAPALSKGWFWLPHLGD